MDRQPDTYAARLQIDYPGQLDRLTTFFRLIWIIPIVIIRALVTGGGGGSAVTKTGEGCVATFQQRQENSFNGAAAAKPRKRVVTRLLSRR